MLLRFLPLSPTAGLLLLPAAVFLASCSERSAEREDGRVVIRYWEKWSGAEAEAMAELVEEFNASQDRIYVEYLSVGQLENKLLLAVAGGNPPDVAGFRSHQIYTYAEMGALTPLDHLMEQGGVSAGDYLPSIMNLCTYRGFTWALPLTPATLALHYNRELFRQAGLDPDAPPDTIADLMVYHQKLTRTDSEGNLVQMGFLPAEPGWWNDRWGIFFGGELIDSTGRATPDSSANVAAYQWVASFPEHHGLSQVQRFASSGQGQFASPQNLFLSGKVAMVLQGVWMSNFIDLYAPELEWSAAPFPRAEGEEVPITLVESDVLVIPKGSPNPMEAWEFIQFTQRQENLEALCLAQRKFTPLRSVSETFEEEHPNPYIHVFRELAESPGAASVPKMPLYPEYADELVNAFDLIWRGRVEPERALQQVRERIQPRLERLQREWDLTAEQRLEEWATP